jgi:hypothetical protein
MIVMPRMRVCGLLRLCCCLPCHYIPRVLNKV